MDHIFRTSLERGWIVTIIYLNDSVITKRNIRVLEIGDNIIKAYCYLRNQIRVFKKENILAADYCRKRPA